MLVSAAEYGPCPTLVRAATLTEYVVSGVNPRGKEYIIMHVNVGIHVL